MKVFVVVLLSLIGVFADLDHEARARNLCRDNNCGLGEKCVPYPDCIGEGCDEEESNWIAACQPDYSDPNICTYPIDGGLCMAYFPRWGYDTEKGKCTRFIYGGCGGNGNRFSTKRSCEAKCESE